MPEQDSTTAPYRLVWDDFKDGFTTEGPNAKWRHFSLGDGDADDGRVSTGPDGLRVRAGRDLPADGRPAFTRTYGQQDIERLGLPGAADHIKWLAHTTHTASTGQPGFDALPGQVLTFETWVRARSHGVQNHPFGELVADPDTDLRLGAAALPLIDPETLTVVTFFLTNRRIYATYERLESARPALGDYASFLFAVPVADRTPDASHHLAISYDRSAGTIHWEVDGTEVHRLGRLGMLPPTRAHMLLDHGGVETPVEPRQLNGGMGMFTILDAAWPTAAASTGPVRISPDSGSYTDPRRGAPHRQDFLDDKSLPGSRLFGQGVELHLERFVVSAAPADVGGRR